MERRVRLHSKYLVYHLILICIWLSSCLEQTSPKASLPTINALGLKLVTRQGFTYINDTPVSAMVYGLYLNQDTGMEVPYRKGKIDGQARYWYENKQLKEIRNYVNGWQEGVARSWWPNGRLKFEYNFANDMYEGTVNEWTDSGIPYKQMHYKKGQEEGEQKLWFENGLLRSNYVITNGRRYGLLGTKNCVNVSDSVFSNP